MVEDYKPVVDSYKPVVDPYKPVIDPYKPVIDSYKPVVDPYKPEKPYYPSPPKPYHPSPYSKPYYPENKYYLDGYGVPILEETETVTESEIEGIFNAHEVDIIYISTGDEGEVVKARFEFEWEVVVANMTSLEEFDDHGVPTEFGAMCNMTHFFAASQERFMFDIEKARNEGRAKTLFDQISKSLIYLRQCSN